MCCMQLTLDDLARVANKLSHDAKHSVWLICSQRRPAIPALSCSSPLAGGKRDPSPSKVTGCW